MKANFYGIFNVSLGRFVVLGSFLSWRFWALPEWVLEFCKPVQGRMEVFDQAFGVAPWQSQAQVTRAKQNGERFNLNLEFVLAFVHSNT